MGLPNYLTVAEVAERLNVSTRTISRWVVEGWVRPLRIGRIVRFDEQELENIVKECAGDPVAFHCSCAGPCFEHEPMKSLPEARQYGPGGNHGEFPDSPDDMTDAQLGLQEE